MRVLLKKYLFMIEVRNIQDFNDYLDTLLNQTECDDIDLKVQQVVFQVVFGTPILLLPTQMVALSCLG